MSVASDPDHALMARVATGDVRAYRLLMAKHLTKGVKVAERMLGNRQDAEDVLQEACLKIWTEAVRWQPRAKFSTWFYRVVVNACLDRRRKATPVTGEDMENFLDDQPIVEERLIEAQKVAHIREALQALPDRQRAAIILSYYEGLSNQIAADALGIRLGAFQQLLFRAKQALRLTLGEGEHVKRTGS